jgi:hypothetical protein
VRAAGSAAALALAACSGTTGTIEVDLVTAPDSHLLDGVQRLRMTITAPRQVVEANRTAAGFDLALELDAGNATGALIVEGFDAAGALIACGQSPAFPIAAINAHVAVYLAPPRSIERSPAALGAARSQVAGAAISYGAVLAGGLEGPADAAVPTTSIAVYNAFDHALSEGAAMPAARAGVAIAAGASGGVYLFGGTGPGGAVTGTLWRFDTTVAPRGSFFPITEQSDHARAGQLLLPIGVDHYLITGAPALEYRTGMLIERSEVAALPAVGAASVPGDNIPAAVFSGAALVRFRNDAFDTLADTGRADATAIALPDRRIALLGGAGTRDAVVINAATGLVTQVPGVLSVDRRHPAVATTPRHVVVAGGTDAAGAPIATADVLDALTLAPIVTLPIIARTGGFAVALPDDQVLLGGGAPASAALELFTPEPPAPGTRT